MKAFDLKCDQMVNCAKTVIECECPSVFSTEYCRLTTRCFQILNPTQVKYHIYMYISFWSSYIMYEQAIIILGICVPVIRVIIVVQSTIFAPALAPSP